MHANQAMHGTPRRAVDISTDRIARLERFVAALNKVRTLTDIVARLKPGKGEQPSPQYGYFTSELRIAEHRLVALDAEMQAHIAAPNTRQASRPLNGMES